MAVYTTIDMTCKAKIVSYMNIINRNDSNNVKKLIAFNNLITVVFDQTFNDKVLSFVMNVFPSYRVLPEDVRTALDVQVFTRRAIDILKHINREFSILAAPDVRRLTQQVVALFKQGKREGNAGSDIGSGRGTRVRTLEERITLCVAETRRIGLTDLEEVIAFNNLQVLTTIPECTKTYGKFITPRVLESYSVLTESVKTTLDTQLYGQKRIRECKEFDLDEQRGDPSLFGLDRNN